MHVFQGWGNGNSNSKLQQAILTTPVKKLTRKLSNKLKLPSFFDSLLNGEFLINTDGHKSVGAVSYQKCIVHLVTVLLACPELAGDKMNYELITWKLSINY